MKKIAAILICLLLLQLSKAQERVITTGVPFLLVAGDARSAGMADNGVATSTDTYSQQWNPAKYSFSLDKQGFSLSYTPYLVELVNDISLGQVNYFNKINDRGAFASSLRFFSLGEIELRQNVDDIPNVVKPAEFAVDLSYSQKLSERFSMAVAGRYIRSNLRIPTEGQSSSAASSFAFDVAGFYQSEETAFTDFDGRWRAGFNFQNMGPKINYDQSSDSTVGSNFLPANLKIGGGFDFILDEYNKVGLNLEFNKLLVPTPQSADLNGDGEENSNQEEVDLRNKNYIEYNKIGWVDGIFKSFNDAPDGFSEELKEVTYSVGAEYMYQDSFAFRLGYFNESPMKGARKFFSLGTGFTYNVVKIDLSYLFSASNVKNPLEHTLRFSLSFAFGDKYDEY
jgi:hypothetical protein